MIKKFIDREIEIQLEADHFCNHSSSLSYLCREGCLFTGKTSLVHESKKPLTLITQKLNIITSPRD